MDFLISGLLEWNWWQITAFTLVTTHITIVAVTIFLHRAQAHRALELAPISEHFFRLWLWLTTGMVTKEFVAVHRKHHARVETPDDPHSPQTRGIKALLLTGVELYREEAAHPETLAKYGHGTPDDWIERHLYSRFSWQGVGLMLILDVLFFGAIGLTVWAVQMVWIPWWATGIINGLGHWWGYRNFDPADASTNVSPWGIVIGGEELHNNHHTYPTSAKFSVKPWEFDIGWAYIRALEIAHGARVKREHLPPQAAFDPNKEECDADTLQAVVGLRYEVLRWFDRMARRYHAESVDWKEWRTRLTALWEERRSESELLANLRAWHADAERSASVALQAFARRLARLRVSKA